jgi:hypothetical protein
MVRVVPRRDIRVNSSGLSIRAERPDRQSNTRRASRGIGGAPIPVGRAPRSVRRRSGKTTADGGGCEERRHRRSSVRVPDASRAPCRSMTIPASGTGYPGSSTFVRGADRSGPHGTAPDRTGPLGYAVRRSTEVPGVPRRPHPAPSSVPPGHDHDTRRRASPRAGSRRAAFPPGVRRWRAPPDARHRSGHVNSWIGVLVGTHRR